MNSIKSLTPVPLTGLICMMIGAAQGGITFETLVHFSGPDGHQIDSGVIQGTDGDFYGTTAYGAVGFDGSYHSGSGTVFKLSADDTVSLLHAFGGGAEGSWPIAGLVEASDRNFYGATYAGGSFYGTIFRITPAGEFTSLYSLNLLNGDGANPDASLIIGTDGNFYGTTQASGNGTIFRLSVPMAPRLQTPVQTVQGLQLTWTAAAGQNYQLQSNSDLASTNWINVGSPILATNGVMSALDSPTSDVHLFYRVSVTP